MSTISHPNSRATPTLPCTQVFVIKMNEQRYWLYFWYSSQWWVSGANPVGGFFTDLNQAHARLTEVLSLSCNKDTPYIISDCNPCVSPAPL